MAQRRRLAGLSSSQVDKLGKRLGSADVPAEDDLRALEEVRRAHEPVLEEVVAILRARLSIAPTPRLKTTGTIIDKLKQKTALSRMQDIAGCRVVSRMTLQDQDDLVADILGLFPGSKVVDRRRDPSFGYRAVHVIVMRDGVRAEIQVRTELQNLWAQLMERLADSWGRQIRYGLPPDDPAKLVADAVPRSDVVAMVLELSDVIRDVEVRRDRLDSMKAVHDASNPPDPGTPEGDQYEAEKDEIVETEQALAEEEAELREIIASLLRVPDLP